MSKIEQQILGLEIRVLKALLLQLAEEQRGPIIEAEAIKPLTPKQMRARAKRQQGISQQIRDVASRSSKRITDLRGKL